MVNHASQSLAFINTNTKHPNAKPETKTAKWSQLHTQTQAPTTQLYHHHHQSHHGMTCSGMIQGQFRPFLSILIIGRYNLIRLGSAQIETESAWIKPSWCESVKKKKKKKLRRAGSRVLRQTLVRHPPSRVHAHSHCILKVVNNYYSWIG